MKFKNLKFLEILRIEHLRHIKDFFGIVFKIDAVKEKKGHESESDEDDDTNKKLEMTRYMLTCVGSGYKNFSKARLV